MSPARRASARAFLDEIGAPEHALARKLIAQPTFAFDLDNPLRLDNCEVCGAIHWRDCVCDLSAPRSAPTPRAVERARSLRLVRAELEPMSPDAEIARRAAEERRLL